MSATGGKRTFGGKQHQDSLRHSHPSSRRRRDMPLIPASIARALFLPLLAGSNAKDRAIACVGALLGIGATAVLCSVLLQDVRYLPMLVAPMGASAVLVFVVPASPLAQPWAVVGGNVISTLIGVTVATYIEHTAFAAAISVASAIVAMSALRCLHPPGGAAALLPVLGSSVMDVGYTFAFAPIAINSLMLVLVGIIFHRATGHSYPHRPVPVTGHMMVVPDDPSFLPEDVDAALADLGETFDVSREDLDLLFRIAERHASERRRVQTK